ncbi:MAG: YfiR family protein [Gemmatimonadales bacterium]
MALLTSARAARVVVGCAVAAAWSSMLVQRAPAQAPAGAPEYQIKAAYLLNFIRYVEWPPSVFEGTEASLNVCVVGRDPFGDVLDRTMAGRRIGGRPLRVLRPARPAGDTCHVAFIGRTTAAAREAWLAALQDEPTLTVGESAGFAEAGGMIAFVIVDETVRFEINVEAVRSGGLQISSRVLTLATRLYPRRGDP